LKWRLKIANIFSYLFIRLFRQLKLNNLWAKLINIFLSMVACHQCTANKSMQYNEMCRDCTGNNSREQVAMCRDCTGNKTASGAAIVVKLPTQDYEEATREELRQCGWFTLKSRYTDTISFHL
jgi:uncharacterized paraquat-inducible protein A